jgi:hypothetical protein
MAKNTRNYGKRQAFQEGGEVEDELEQTPSRSIYGDMDVSSMAKRAVDADNKAYQAASPAERARLDEARKRTPGYKRGGIVKRKK